MKLSSYCSENQAENDYIGELCKIRGESQRWYINTFGR